MALGFTGMLIVERRGQYGVLGLTGGWAIPCRLDKSHFGRMYI
jgi:hypothetical protein